MNCFFCKKEIDQEKPDSYVILKTPDGKLTPCHLHKGVKEEKRKQSMSFVKAQSSGKMGVGTNVVYGSEKKPYMKVKK